MAVVGVPLFWAMQAWPTAAVVLFVVAVSATAVWLHTVGDRILGEKDSRRLVWDEVAGFLVAVALVPFTWQLALAAFLIERTLDIVKVPPADWIERHWRGGWGVVGDDVVAGLYTRAVLQLLLMSVPEWAGIRG